MSWPRGQDRAMEGRVVGRSLPESPRPLPRVCLCCSLRGLPPVVRGPRRTFQLWQVSEQPRRVSREGWQTAGPSPQH